MCRFLGRRQRRRHDWARAGVREAPRHEVAGRRAPRVQRALWRLMPGAEVARDVHEQPGVTGAAVESRWCHGAGPNGCGYDRHRHAPRHDYDLGTSSGCAGGWPACASHRARGRCRGHDVSILITATGGDARCRGIVPRSKISITIMRPPQRGHGHGSALG
jgi:hypothetical protein